MAIRAANQKHHREFGTHAGRQYWECTKHVVNVYVVNSVASIPCVQRVLSTIGQMSDFPISETFM